MYPTKLTFIEDAENITNTNPAKFVSQIRNTRMENLFLAAFCAELLGCTKIAMTKVMEIVMIEITELLK